MIRNESLFAPLKKYLQTSMRTGAEPTGLALTIERITYVTIK